MACDTPVLHKGLANLQGSKQGIEPRALNTVANQSWVPAGCTEEAVFYRLAAGNSAFTGLSRVQSSFPGQLSVTLLGLMAQLDKL